MLVSFPLEPQGIVAEVPPVADEARRGWRSGQNPSALQAGKGFWEPQEGMTFPFIFSFSKIVSLVSARRRGVTFAQSSAKVTKSALCGEKPKEVKKSPPKLHQV